MKRRLGRILMSVLLGVLSTIGVAWLLSYLNWWSYPKEAAVPTLFVEDDAAWQVTTWRRIGAARASSRLVWRKDDPSEVVRIVDPEEDSRGEVWVLKDERATVFLGDVRYAKGMCSGWKDVPLWSAARRREWPLTNPFDGRRAVALDCAWGWPFLAMRYTEHRVHGSPSARSWDVTRGDLTLPSMPRSPSWQPPRRVPLLPISLGFAIDMAVYGLLWLGVIESVIRRLARGRRKKRMRRGLCPACGYDLRAAGHERCPECGEGVPADPGR